MKSFDEKENKNNKDANDIINRDRNVVDCLLKSMCL